MSMNGSRASRWLIWSGPLFAVLFLIVSFSMGNAPSENASGAKLITYYHDHRTGLLASVFLSPLAAVLLVLFAAQVRARARNAAENLTGPTVLVSGAVLWAAGLLLGSTIGLAQLDAADKKQAEASVALNFLSSASWIPFIAGIAVFLVGAGMTGLGSRITPRWLGWAALVVGIVSLAGPGGFIGFFGGPLWMLIAGIMLAVGSGNRSAAHPAAPAG
jgi:MFS family permease